MDGYVELEFDLLSALLVQLVKLFEGMKAAELTEANIKQIALDAEGVYQLFYDGKLVYIGKSDTEAGLLIRLTRHAKKVRDRKGLDPTKVTFKAIKIAVFASMDLETQLIKRYKKPEWNNSGFGSNDPGRNREETNKKPLGFDRKFPINIDIPLSFIVPKTCEVAELLKELKKELPYTFRYEITGKSYKTGPHPDYSVPVTIPRANMTMCEVMRLILAVLPPEWQATEFPSHVILYKETRSYTHGTPIV